MYLDGVGLMTSTFEASCLECWLFFHGFLPVMASDYTSTNYYESFFKSRCVQNRLALWLRARTCWQWAGPKLHSLLYVNAHHLIGAHFLTTNSDKCMRLLTRLYGASTRSLKCHGYIISWHAQLLWTHGAAAWVERRFALQGSGLVGLCAQRRMALGHSAIARLWHVIERMARRSLSLEWRERRGVYHTCQ